MTIVVLSDVAKRSRTSHYLLTIFSLIFSLPHVPLFQLGFVSFRNMA
jgi:hypothetical protein